MTTTVLASSTLFRAPQSCTKVGNDTPLCHIFAFSETAKAE
jgi:hypothetical protein